jgi:hypothetical protein
LVGLFAFAGSGCGTDDPEPTIKEAIADTNALAEAIERNESAETIKAAGDKMQATMNRLSRLRVSRDKDAEMKRKYEKDFVDAGTRLEIAGAKNPDGAKAVQDIMKSIGKKGP